MIDMNRPGLAVRLDADTLGALQALAFTLSTILEDTPVEVGTAPRLSAWLDRLRIGIVSPSFQGRDARRGVAHLVCHFGRSLWVLPKGGRDRGLCRLWLFFRISSAKLGGSVAIVFGALCMLRAYTAPGGASHGS